VNHRLQEALAYRALGLRPLPIKPGTKALALPKGARVTYEKRPPTDRELQQWFPNDRKNLALLLGPACNLLIINVNMKHGHNGLASLNGLSIPPTPTILTPHDGLAYLFRVPDRERFPSPFKTHTTVPGFPPNAIELRGAGGYQVVPSSHLEARTRGDGTIDPGGDYHFAEPWTLTRVFHDLDDLPAWLLDLWIASDRMPQHQMVGAVRRTTRVVPKPMASSCIEKDTTTGHAAYSTTVYGEVLGASVVEAMTQDRALEESCAQFLGLRVDGRNFACPLPGHDEAHSSASMVWNQKGELVLRDWHRRHGKEFWAIPEVYAALTIGHIATDDRGFAVSLKGPSMVTWRIRLWVARGVIKPVPVPMPPLPSDEPRSVAKVYSGIRLLYGCKWHYEPGAPTVLAWSFVAGWCGVGIEAAGKAIRWIVERQILVLAGRERGHLVYLPGEVE
jgi:hypothetical protein